MFSLLVLLLERIGITVTVAFILTRTPLIRRLINREQIKVKEGIYLIIIFGLFGILGTYTGIPVQGTQSLAPTYGGPVAQQQALANSRVVGPFIAGLLGGPLIGFGAGLVAGVHRSLLGGFTGLSCGLATVLEGVLAGFIGHKFGRVHIRPSTAFGFGALAEALQMVIILLLARPFVQAVALVKLIALPMIVSNAAGITIFVLILQSVLSEEQRAGVVQTNKSLQIADKTLPYLRGGLNYTTAKATAEIIKKTIYVVAVTITDQEQILAHVGVGDNFHQPGSKLTQASLRVLKTGELYIARTKDEIDCANPACQLTASIVLPLKRQDKILGTLHLSWSKYQISPVDLELAQGLAHLFSTQLELARLDEQSRLLAKAEIKALQAQINPHFLFNCLNVIVSMYREQPETARHLLINLGDFFRQNLQSSTQELVTLEKEISHIRSYLVIEKARFQEELQVSINVDSNMLDVLLPPLTLQPLVENAIKHGLRPQLGGGTITIKAQQIAEGIQISITDNGRGMAPEKLDSCLLEGGTTEKGIGLTNVHQRLVGTFGKESGLKIKSQQYQGTKVSFFIPQTISQPEEVTEIDRSYGGRRRGII